MKRLSDEVALSLQTAVEEIAARNGITIDWRGKCRGRAWRKTREVRIQPITTMGRYAIALHEIGHILGPIWSNTRLEKEFLAWDWAVQNAPIPFDEAAWMQLHICLRNYVSWAKSRQYRSKSRPVIPKKNHPLWHLIAKAKGNF